MTYSSPAFRALLLASVAAAPLYTAARPGGPRTDRTPAGSASPGAGWASGRVAAPGPAGWLPGRRYAANLPRDVANDASPDGVEPVTREYERYAQLEPAASADRGAATATRIGGFGVAPASPRSVVPASDPLPAPIQTAQGDTGSFTNPFRTTSIATPDEPVAGGPRSTSLRPPGAALSATPADPLTSEIDRNIQQVSAEVAPRLEQSVSLRGRSGSEGLGKLFALEAPLEASFSPAGYGRLKVQVTPSYLYAGRISASDNRIYGSNPVVPAALTPNAQKSNTATGVGLDVGYAYDFVSADIGASPVGFRQSHIIGGVEFAPRLSNSMLLRVVADRRPVTDSLLSFGGAKDPRTGQEWGGVTRSRGHIQLEGSVFNDVYYYAGAGGGVLLGEQVKSNKEVDAGAGFTVPVFKTPTQEVRVGLNLVYFAYDRNLGNFTIGNGGYFSPQQFFAALIPVTFRHQVTPDLVYTVGGSVGAQTFRAKSQLVFPTDTGLQAQLAALNTAGTASTATRFAGFSGTGVAGGASGEIDYRVNNNLHIGAKAGFDRSGNFTEGTGLVYARYVFNDSL